MALTSEVYKKNQRKAKIINKVTPIVFWSCLALAVLFFILALKNSIGNVIEIFELLDKQKFNNVELEQNYAILVEKYGEINLGGANGGFAITYVNVKKALINGLGLVCFEMSIVFLASAFILAKWLLPKWSKSIQENNQDMVNLTILENNEKKG